MQNNFTQFNADAVDIKTREFNGLTLVWSPEDSRFMLPLPDMTEPKRKILFDESTNSFIQITIDNPSFVYRDRKATAPDGTVMQEKIFIGRDKSGNVVELPDAEFQRQLIVTERQKLWLQLISGAQMSVPLFFIGVVICLISFFWNLAASAGIVAQSFATGSLMAMKEVGYYLAWGFCVLIGAWFLYHVGPILFRARSQPDEYSTPGALTNEQKTTTNIVVNNITGTGNTAQDYINRRDIK